MSRKVNLLIVTDQGEKDNFCIGLNCWRPKHNEGEFGKLYFDEVMMCCNRLANDGYNVSVKFVDRIYEFTSSQASQFSSIKYDDFNINDPKYMDKDAHNIVVDFVNLLDENWVAFDMHEQRMGLYEAYKDYKFALLACGPFIKKGFPNDAVMEIVKKGYETPRQYWSAKGFCDAIALSNRFKNEGIENTMKPFMQGVFQMIGTLQYRGMAPNYSSEEPVRDMLKIRNIIQDPSAKKFINGEIRFHEIAMHIKEYLYPYFDGVVKSTLLIQHMLTAADIPIKDHDIVRFTDQQIRYNTLCLATRLDLNKHVYGDVYVI